MANQHRQWSVLDVSQGKLMAQVRNLGEYGAIFADDQLLISFETPRW